MKYMIRAIQISLLLGGLEFLIMLLFGNLTESAKQVVLGVVLVAMILSGILGIIDRKLVHKENKLSIF